MAVEDLEKAIGKIVIRGARLEVEAVRLLTTIRMYKPPADFNKAYRQAHEDIRRSATRALQLCKDEANSTYLADVGQRTANYIADVVDRAMPLNTARNRVVHAQSFQFEEGVYGFLKINKNDRNGFDREDIQKTADELAQIAEDLDAVLYQLGEADNQLSRPVASGDVTWGGEAVP